ncbi:MAG: hypothetical protein Q8M55_03515, partial [Actinomycetota bacterium]|nr:hypothetical protein [Actinomycetota bacterium]
TEARVTCTLLHVVETQDQRPYDDPDVKDVVGAMPQFYCAYCNPIKRLRPGEAMKCLTRNEPCWMPADRICADRA